MSKARWTFCKNSWLTLTHIRRNGNGKSGILAFFLALPPPAFSKCGLEFVSLCVGTPNFFLFQSKNRASLRLNRWKQVFWHAWNFLSPMDHFHAGLFALRTQPRLGIAKTAGPLVFSAFLVVSNQICVKLRIKVGVFSG